MYILIGIYTYVKYDLGSAIIVIKINNDYNKYCFRIPLYIFNLYIHIVG